MPTMDNVSEDAFVMMKNSNISMTKARQPPRRIMPTVCRRNSNSWYRKACSDEAKATPYREINMTHTRLHTT